MREVVLHRSLNPMWKNEQLIRSHPSLSFRSLHNNIGGGRQVMLQHWQGTRSALALVKRDYVGHPPDYMETLELVEEDTAGLLIFSVERTGYGLDVAALIERHLGPNTVSSLEKGVDGSTWRILTQAEANVERFLRALAAAEAEHEERTGGAIARYKIRSTSRRAKFTTNGDLLTPLEKIVLQLAIGAGYYAVPRKIGIAQVAKKLKMPPSTALYHLRRAQRKVLEGFAGAG